MLCVPAIALAALATAAPPAWYTGRHAVLLVVDGLGDGELDARLQRGQLPALQRHFGEGGRRLPATSWWPQRGPAEACSVATGHPQDLRGEACLAPAGLADDPRAVLVADGGPRRDLHALVAGLEALPADALPPVALIVQEDRFASAAARHGPTSAQATEALAAIDRDVDALVRWYAGRELLARTTLVLVGPAGVSAAVRQVDVDASLAALLAPRDRRQGRLQNLLHAFSPLDVRHRGGLTLVQPRRAASGGGDAPASSLGELLDATGRGARSASAVLQELGRAPGVALVVAREAVRPDAEVLAVQGPSGLARLEQRPDGQIRYTVLRGQDPLGQEALDPDLARERFHAASIWLAQPGRWASAVARVAGLLALEPGSVLGLVAEDGVRFDDTGAAAGLTGRAAVWMRGLGTPPGELAIQARQIGPTLLALVGAPLDEAQAALVVDELVEVDQVATVQSMCQELVRRTRGAFTASRAHDSSVIDTSELRRFGAPLPYFGALEAGLLADDPLSYLPEPSIQAQIGPRRSLLVAATRLSARIESLVLKHHPADIRRFDPLIRPELLLAGLLADPRMRSTLRVLEGPATRSRVRAARDVAAPAP